MLVIRLARIGRKNKASFRIVLQDKTQAPKSAAKEQLGSYNPHLKERKDQIQLNTERVQYWLKLGAQPSDTMHNMLIELGIIKGDKRRVVGTKKGAKAAAEKAEADAIKAAAEAKAAAEKPAEAAPEAAAPAEETPKA
jgi:small subunit ribosomal protein S16